MQFCIQRPTLPSAEAHPEEKLYRRLDVSIWLRHLNQSGQVEEEYKLRKVGPRDGPASPTPGSSLFHPEAAALKGVFLFCLLFCFWSGVFSGDTIRFPGGLSPATIPR